MLTIDGSIGEGGGQILRTALSLAAITGTPVRFERIRARRPKPGLMRQHLACVKAVAELCGGELSGAELNSQELELKPGAIRGGSYRFVIGSAGSTILLAQTLLPVMLFADSPSVVTLEGGTHADHAPVFEFFAQVFLPCLRKLGVTVDTTLDRYGFFPVGGGQITLSTMPARAWRQFSLTERGDLREARVTALGSGLDRAILTDELQFFQAGLADTPAFSGKISEVPSPGSGNVLFAELRYANLTELFSTCGNFSLSRANVAKRTLGQVMQYLRNGWVVGQYLADQLLLPLALGAGGHYLTGQPTRHAETNAEVIRKFLNVKINFIPQTDRLYEMEVSK